MPSVRAATLNNYKTMACAMGHDDCVESPPEESWQALLATPAAPLPVFQDRAPGVVWDAFGAGHDDLLVYDRAGRVFAWLPSPGTVRMSGLGPPLSEVKQDLLDAEGVANVRDVLERAIAASPDRCDAAEVTASGAAGSLAAWLAPLLVVLALVLAVGGGLGWRRLRQRRPTRPLAARDAASEVEAQPSRLEMLMQPPTL